jgi:hypothetical protein
MIDGKWVNQGWTNNFEKMERTNPSFKGVQKFIEIDGFLYGIPYEGRTPIMFDDEMQELYKAYLADRE